MSQTISMPKLGFDMQEGTLVRWVKNIGDTISEGDVIAEIETDKATVEVEAYVSGTLLQTLVEENSIVAVGAPIAVVGGEGESVEAASAPAAKEEKPAPAAAPTQESAPQAAETSAPISKSNGNGYPDGVKASPVARRIAEERGLSLESVTGTGPGGRIVKRDIEGFTPGVDAPAAPIAGKTEVSILPSAAPSYAVLSGVDYEEIPLTRMRKIVGERTGASFQHVPHFYVTNEIDMAPVMALRKQINSSLPDESKVTVNDLIVKAVAITLRKFPNLNTHFHGDKLVRYKRINIGMAVAVENGLINVVCLDADKRTLSDIATVNKPMISRAREGRIKPEDVEGATFTVSNLGPYDVDFFSAIINPPESAILAVGSAREVPVVVNGEVKVGVRMKATISIDHRVSDGAEGGDFMKQLKELLENPMRLLI